VVLAVSRVWTNWAHEVREGFRLRKEKKPVEKKPSAERAVREQSTREKIALDIRLNEER